MRKMSQANEAEFNELASYVGFFATHVWKVAIEEPSHPSHFLSSGKFTRSQLLTGLRQAANDTIEALSSISPQQIVVLDRACRDSGVLTFTEVRRRFSRQYKSILKRQRIARDSDYYLITAIVNDMESPLSDNERRGLEALIAAYEATVKPR